MKPPNSLPLRQNIEPLKTNDIVALACTGSKCTSFNHPQIAKDYLNTQYQLNAVFTDETLNGYSPQQRAHFFLEHLFNHEVKLIAALRGGEGSADILPFVHQYQERIKTLKPKWLLGLSDFTAILVYFAQHYQWPVIHGSSVLQFAENRVDQPTEKMTMNLLFQQTPFELPLIQLTPLNSSAQETKTITGPLTGGCLSLIDISIKDIWELNTENKIIFFEDCGEKAHKILRTLKYFSRIGLFKSIRAVILVDFNCYPIGCMKQEQLENHSLILKTLTSFAAHQDFPVLHTTQIGHGATNLPLMYNTQYQLTLGKNPNLILGSNQNTELF